MDNQQQMAQLGMQYASIITQAHKHAEVALQTSGYREAKINLRASVAKAYSEYWNNPSPALHLEIDKACFALSALEQINKENMGRGGRN